MVESVPSLYCLTQDHLVCGTSSKTIGVHFSVLVIIIIVFERLPYFKFNCFFNFVSASNNLNGGTWMGSTIEFGDVYVQKNQFKRLLGI